MLEAHLIWRVNDSTVSDHFISRCIEQVGSIEKVDGYLNIVLANNDLTHALNKDFRDKSQPTNVLAFPSGEKEFLGEIIVSLEYVRKEARLYHKSFEDRLAHMIVHGTLHLLGYDHIDAFERDTMECKERYILSRLGIEDPYIEGEANSVVE